MGRALLRRLGQQECERRRRERPLVRKLADPELNQAVRVGLTQEWSPEQIAGRLEQQHPECPDRCVAPQTIYHWIQQDPHREHLGIHFYGVAENALVLCQVQKFEVGLNSEIWESSANKEVST